MYKFLILISGLLFFSDIPMADENRVFQEIKLTYKAYWGGFVISKVYSAGKITPTDYQVDVSYAVTGLASIFSHMKNKVSVRGKIAPDGSLKPLIFENQGSWGSGSFSNRTEFNEQDSKIISHDYKFNFKEDVKYIPIRDDLRYGPDMVSFYLGLTLDDEAMSIRDEMTHQNIFGGFFLLDVGHRCLEYKLLETKRSVFTGEALVCEFSDKVVDGGFESIKKKKRSKKKKKKNTDTMEPVPLQIWYGKIDGLDHRVPVYSEFPISWGKVRVYLSKIEVITQ